MISKCTTGLPGLDEILGGGLPRNNMYLLQGKPGTGKTTLAIQFLLEGVRQEESCLYISFSETKAELDLVAESHGWDLAKISILELSILTSEVSAHAQTTVFSPSEVEFNKTIEFLLKKIIEVNPQRIVFDSISELRLLGENSHRYRRQMLSFKQFFIGRSATVFFLDDLSSPAGDVHVQSIVHGVLLLEKFRAGYGVERRQFHISKLRGVNFRGGTHDYAIVHGGITIFPRLTTVTEHDEYEPGVLKSDIVALDNLIGGGLDKGTSNLILGPPGTGKSTIALRFAVRAAAAGKRVSIYSFEETKVNIVKRCKALDLDIEPHVKSGRLTLRKIEPAELTPGQFTSLLREVNEVKSDVVIVDDLNGYIHAMPEQQFLLLQLHELFSYLNGRGVITIIILAQAGLVGQMQTPLDLTYLADTVIVTRFFEAYGHIKKAISVIKKRTGTHEETLRELKIGPGGIMVGPILHNFIGIFSGTARYAGDALQIFADD